MKINDNRYLYCVLILFLLFGIIICIIVANNQNDRLAETNNKIENMNDLPRNPNIHIMKSPLVIDQARVVKSHHTVNSSNTNNSNAVNLTHTTNFPQTMNTKDYTDDEQPGINHESETNEIPKKGVIKIIVYHMQNCSICSDIMNTIQKSGKTKYEELKEIFKNDSRVKIINFEYGKDIQANKYNAFPVIRVLTINSDDEYNGPREVLSIVKYIATKKIM